MNPSCTRAEASDYTFLDCFHLTRTIRGNLSAGASAGFFHISDSTSYLVGQVVTYGDQYGAWSMHARGGSYFEGRVTRVLSF